MPGKQHRFIDDHLGSFKIVRKTKAQTKRLDWIGSDVWVAKSLEIQTIEIKP